MNESARHTRQRSRLSGALLGVLAWSAASGAAASSLQLLAIADEPLSGLPDGVVVSWFDHVAIGPDGTLATLVALAGSGVHSGNDRAVLARMPGTASLQLVVREGTTAIGGATAGDPLSLRVTEEGVVFASGTSGSPRTQLWLARADGTISAYATFGGLANPEPHFDWAVASDRYFMAKEIGGSVLFPSHVTQPVVAPGDPAPGLPGYTFQFLQQLQVNATGMAGMHAWVNNGADSIRALYTSDLASGDASPALRVVEGDVSRPGEVFSSISDPTVLDRTLLFYGYSANAAGGAAVVDGLWELDGVGTVTPVLLKGQVLPDGRVSWVSPYASVQAGHPDKAALRAGLEAGGTVSSTLFYYDSTAGTLQPLLGEGDPVDGAPGLVLGALDLGGLDLNEAGQVGFVAYLKDGAGNVAGEAAVATLPDGRPQALLRRGSIQAGAACKTYDVSTISAGGDGRPGLTRGMSAAGEMWLLALLDSDGDGIEDTAALFVASPEGDARSLGCPAGIDTLFRNGFE